jgi:hypothetical protein
LLVQTTAILADMLLNSTFQPDAIEREKKTILQVAVGCSYFCFCASAVDDASYGS